VDSKCANAYLLLGLSAARRCSPFGITKRRSSWNLAPTPPNDLALAYLKENKVRDARGELEHTVALDPKQPNAAYDLGIVLLKMGSPLSRFLICAMHMP
jgi:Tfp pilus assembly protein PilF